MCYGFFRDSVSRMKLKKVSLPNFLKGYLTLNEVSAINGVITP